MRRRRDLALVAAIGAAGWAVYRLERIAFLLTLAMFFAYVIAPIVQRAERPIRIGGRQRTPPRWAAIVVVYLLLATAAAAGAALLWPAAVQQFDEAIASGPAYGESFHGWERASTRYYERLRIPIELRRSINRSATGATDAAVATARASFVLAIGAVSQTPVLLLVPVLAFFLLKDAAAIRRSTLIKLPHAMQLRIHRLLEALNATLAAYVRAQLIACVVVGVLVGTGFALLGTPYATLLGVIAGALEFVPLVGPLIIGVAATAIAALHSPGLAVRTAVFLAVLRVIQDYVIYPRLIGRDLHMHPLAVILAVLAGAELGGIAGLFIAVPLVAVATVIARHALEWRVPPAVAP
ncbi:MAG: AI-2E family transporter [Acidobacteria bacterium]|nr:AI-2E family transporter [Acidobacteriota bacterium]